MVIKEPVTLPDLITVHPETRIKGFDSQQLRIAVPTPSDQNIARRLKECSNPEEHDIIARVIGSYHRFLAGEPAEPVDFLLSGHELAEVARVSDKNFTRYIIYRYRYNKFPELQVVDKNPPCLQIEPTSSCNFRCVMCYQIDPSFNKKSSGFMGNMKMDLFKSCIDQAEGNIEAVTFASRGEPLLHPQLPEMLEYCRDKFLALKLNTNASLLTEKRCHTLLSSDLQTLVFSIDAADKANYEKIRVNGQFEQLLNNLEVFTTVKKRHYKDNPIIVRISGVKINEQQDINSMHDQWKRFADIVAFSNYNPWQSSYENEVNNIETPCTELWRRMFVWWDGKVNPCDFDYKSTLSHWNAHQVKLSEIWDSEAYNTLRAAHISKLRASIEPCKRCIVT